MVGRGLYRNPVGCDTGRLQRANAFANRVCATRNSSSRSCPFRHAVRYDSGFALPITVRCPLASAPGYAVPDSHPSGPKSDANPSTANSPAHSGVPSSHPTPVHLGMGQGTP